MPVYRRKICCACTEPVPKRPRAPKRQLTDEEKEDAKFKREVNKLLREKKKEWEATLRPWRGDETMKWPLNTFVSGQIIFATGGSELTAAPRFACRLFTKAMVSQCEVKIGGATC